MKKIKFHLGTGFVGANHEDTFTFEDDETEKEIEETFEEWVWSKLDGFWEEVEE